MQHAIKALSAVREKAIVVAESERRKKMRVLSQTELSRMSKAELSALLHAIVCELPRLHEGTQELRDAHANLQNIRRALARPELRPC